MKNPKLTTLRKHSANSRVVAVTYTKQWYGGYGTLAPHPAQWMHLAVVEWLETTDGRTMEMEGKTTHGLVRDMKDAVLIFNRVVKRNQKMEKKSLLKNFKGRRKAKQSHEKASKHA